eukprot:4531288-Amphidinium_carterae.1
MPLPLFDKVTAAAFVDFVWLRFARETSSSWMSSSLVAYATAIDFAYFCGLHISMAFSSSWLT